MKAASPFFLWKLLLFALFFPAAQDSLGAFGAAPVISQKGKAQVQKVLFTIEISHQYPTIDNCLLAFEKMAKGKNPDPWGVYVRVGTSSPFYISKRDVCATSTSCDDGICFVEPSSGRVLSPTTDNQRKSFPKFQYVGRICATKVRAKGERKLAVRLDASAGAFSTPEHAALSFDEAVRKLPDAQVVEYGGLILNRDYSFYRTSLLKGTSSRSIIAYPESKEVFADSDGTLWAVNTKIYYDFVQKGKTPKSKKEEAGNILAVVGRWHSHPNGKDTAGFSGTDYNSFSAAGVPSYLSDSGEVLRLSNSDEKPGDVMSIAKTGDGGFSLAEKKYDEETRENFRSAGEGTDVYLPDSAEGAAVYRKPSTENGRTAQQIPVTSKDFFGKPNGSFFK